MSLLLRYLCGLLMKNLIVRLKLCSNLYLNYILYIYIYIYIIHSSWKSLYHFIWCNRWSDLNTNDDNSCYMSYCSEEKEKESVNDEQSRSVNLLSYNSSLYFS